MWQKYRELVLRRCILMKKKILLTCLVLQIVLLCAGCDSGEKEISLKYNEVNEVAKIQLDSYKITPNEFGEDKVEGFMEKLEQAAALEDGKEIVREEDPESYEVYSLIYNDGERDMFYFFKNEGVWYIETMQGTIFYGEDALREIVNAEDVDGGSGFISVTEDEEAIRKQIELKNSFEEESLEYYFATNLLQKELAGYTRETALEDVKMQMKQNYCLYNALLEAGYEVTDDEIAEEIAEKLEFVKQAENYEEYYAEVGVIYEEMGTSLEEIMWKEKEGIRYNLLMEKLYVEKYEEFRLGNDSIGNEIYDDFVSYYNAYMAEEILPLTEKYDLTELEKVMEEYGREM